MQIHYAKCHFIECLLQNVILPNVMAPFDIDWLDGHGKEKIFF